MIFDAGWQLAVNGPDATIHSPSAPARAPRPSCLLAFLRKPLPSFLLGAISAIVQLAKTHAVAVSSLTCMAAGILVNILIFCQVEWDFLSGWHLSLSQHQFLFSVKDQGKANFHDWNKGVGASDSESEALDQTKEGVLSKRYFHTSKIAQNLTKSWVP